MITSPLSFPFCSRNSCSHSCCYPGFPPSDNVLNTSSLLNNVFLQVWNLGLTVLSALEKCCALSSGLLVSGEKSAVRPKLLFPHRQGFIFSAFRIFPLPLVIRSWPMMCLGMNLSLSCSGFTQLIDSIGLILLPDLGSFQPFSLSVCFPAPVLLISFWDAVTWMSDLLLQCYKSLKLSSFPQQPFSVAQTPSFPVPSSLAPPAKSQLRRAPTLNSSLVTISVPTSSPWLFFALLGLLFSVSGVIVIAQGSIFNWRLWNLCEIALTSLSSPCWRLFVSVMWVEIFLVHGMSEFSLKPGHFRCYVMRFWSHLSLLF